MSSLFSRLAIGTANWGLEYNGSRVSDDDQKRILDYAQEVGIDMIDTATAYGVDFTKWDKYFKVVVKIGSGDGHKALKSTFRKRHPYCIMAHDVKYYCDMIDEYRGIVDSLGHGFGASLYKLKDVNTVWGSHVIQVPYSLYDRRFESCFLTDSTRSYPGVKVHEIHVRSIFLRGKILSHATPQDCIAFCLCNPYIDRVIIGADSFEQFKSNVNFLDEWNGLEKHDEKLLDPRQWKEVRND